MSGHKTTLAVLMTLAGVSASSPVWAQAAVQSDSPVPNRGSGLSNGADALRGQSDPSALPVPETAAGSPGTTGTGAAGTGPTNTMAAPGR